MLSWVDCAPSVRPFQNQAALDEKIANEVTRAVTQAMQKARIELRVLVEEMKTDFKDEFLSLRSTRALSQQLELDVQQLRTESRRSDSTAADPNSTLVELQKRVGAVERIVADTITVFSKQRVGAPTSDISTMDSPSAQGQMLKPTGDAARSGIAFQPPSVVTNPRSPGRPSLTATILMEHEKTASSNLSISGVERLPSDNPKFAGVAWRNPATALNEAHANPGPLSRAGVRTPVLVNS